MDPSRELQLPPLISGLILAIWISSLVIIIYSSLQPKIGYTAQIWNLDKLLHLLSYFWLALLLVTGLRTNKMTLIAGFSLILLGITLEVCQTLVPGRLFSLWDMSANSLGVILGIVLGSKLKSLLVHALGKS